jgi:hypothetical protein
MTESKRGHFDFSLCFDLRSDSLEGIGTGEQPPDDQGKVETVFARTAMGRVDIC